MREQAQEVRKIFLSRVPPEREREASLREKSCLGVDGGSRWPSGGGNTGGDWSGRRRRPSRDSDDVALRQCAVLVNTCLRGHDNRRTRGEEGGVALVEVVRNLQALRFRGNIEEWMRLTPLPFMRQRCLGKEANAQALYKRRSTRITEYQNIRLDRIDP